jgi:Fe-S-cluster containining protein
MTGDGKPAADGADCVDCGLCCHHEPQTVQLRRVDEERMGEDLIAEFTETMRKPPFFRFMKNDGTRCIALDVTKPGKFPCRIYAHRPDGCRIVEPGSPACMQARELGHLGTSLLFRREDA